MKCNETNRHMKKVLFIYPGIAHIGYNSYDSAIDLSDSDPIYAFSLLSGIILEKGWEVELIDLRQMKNEAEAFQRLEKSDARIVAISIQTPSFDIACRIACLAKGLNKIVIGGGIHATVAPEDFELLPYWDHVITGEAERAFPSLLEQIETGATPAKMIHGGILDDLNELPLPYFFPEWEEKHKRLYSIEIARGCPGKCSFCVSGEKRFFKKIRFRSITHIMREIDHAYELFKFKQLLFLDVCASMKKEYFIELMTILSEKYAHISIITQERVDTFNEDVAKLLAKFKNRTVWFGFESASPRILHFINKSSSIEKAKKTVKICKKYGLSIGANVLIGIPTETESDIQLTYDFIKEIKPELLFCNILSPFPGTKIHQYCQENEIFPEISTYEMYELRNVLTNGFLRGIDYDTVRYWHKRFNLLIRQKNVPVWKTHCKRIIFEKFDRKFIDRVLSIKITNYLVFKILGTKS